MRVLVLLAFLVLTSPIGSLAEVGTCGPLGTGCQPIPPFGDKSGMVQMQVQLHVHADTADNSSAVENVTFENQVQGITSCSRNTLPNGQYNPTCCELPKTHCDHCQCGRTECCQMANLGGCNRGDWVLISSHRNQELADHHGRAIMYTHGGTWERWRITNAGSGKVYITSHRNQQLKDDRGRLLVHVNADSWEKWTLTDAGNGKVFITSHRNQQLEDRGGRLGLHSHRGEDQKWTIRPRPVADNGAAIGNCFQAATCAPPSAPDTTGRNCPAYGCLNHNAGYGTLAAAWSLCGSTDGCAHVMAYSNGKFYLRRRDDPARGNDGTTGYTYNCDVTASTTTTTTTTQAPQNCAGVWGGWRSCSASCGGGTQSRSFAVQRNPAYGGSSCPSHQSQQCNADACPVDCVGAWAAWSTCSSPCGGGQQTRRHVITTQAADGGVQCPSPESQQCSPLPCPVDCAGSWDMWSSCSEECGGGTQTRTFNVTTAAAHGGVDCPTPESQQCSSSPCPVDCQGSFAAWTPCSKSCGGGTQSRTFNVTFQASHGGDDCPASPESQACNSRECPMDCAGSWQEWGQCSLECAGGTRSRILTVTIAAAHDGAACPTSPDSQVCNAHRCPVDCHGSWQEWGPCSRACGCGGGTQSAAFNASVPSADGGRACPASPKTRVCNNHACDPYEGSTTSVPSITDAGCEEVSTTPSPRTEAPTATAASNQGASTTASPTADAPTAMAASMCDDSCMTQDPVDCSLAQCGGCPPCRR